MGKKGLKLSFQELKEGVILGVSILILPVIWFGYYHPGMQTLKSITFGRVLFSLEGYFLNIDLFFIPLGVILIAYLLMFRNQFVSSKLLLGICCILIALAFPLFSLHTVPGFIEWLIVSMVVGMLLFFLHKLKTFTQAKYIHFIFFIFLINVVCISIGMHAQWALRNIIHLIFLPYLMVAFLLAAVWEKYNSIFARGILSIVVVCILTFNILTIGYYAPMRIVAQDLLYQSVNDYENKPISYVNPLSTSFLFLKEIMVDPLTDIEAMNRFIQAAIPKGELIQSNGIWDSIVLQAYNPEYRFNAPNLLYGNPNFFFTLISYHPYVLLNTINISHITEEDIQMAGYKLQGSTKVSIPGDTLRPDPFVHFWRPNEEKTLLVYEKGIKTPRWNFTLSQMKELRDMKMTVNGIPEDMYRVFQLSPITNITIHFN